MEHWSLQHERGLIELYTGTNRQLRVFDPEFPEGRDRVRLLVLVDGQVRFRARAVSAVRLSLERFYTRPQPGKYGGGIDFSAPYLAVRSNLRSTFLTGAEVHTKKGVEVIPPPEDAQVVRRNQEAPVWKKKVFAISDELDGERAFYLLMFGLPLVYAVLNFILALTGVVEPETIYVKVAAALVLAVGFGFYGLRKNKASLQGS